MKTRRTLDDLLGSGTPSRAVSPRRAAPSRSRRGDKQSNAFGAAFALVGGAYEGASLRNREIALWNPSNRSADADILPARLTAQARARDIVRDDAYAYAGEQLHRDGVVGSLFALNCKPNLIALGMDPDSKSDKEWEKKFQAEVESKFTLYAESIDCWVDAARKNTLTEMVRLAVGVHLNSGEVLASAEWINKKDRPFKTAIQMLESERLSSPPTGLGYVSQTGRRIRDGIVSDRFGAPLTYWVRDTHPSDVAEAVNDPSKLYTWGEYPARMAWGRMRMLHLFEQDRVDQTRGITRMVHALKEMKTTKHFRDIVLQNAVVNATFAASIEAELPGQHEGILGDGDNEALVNWAANYLGAVGEYSGGSKSLTIDGVRIPHLFPGQKLQLRPAGQGGPLGMEMEQSLLRYIAAMLGVSYEELSRDYSQSNYSSMRAALNQTWRHMATLKKSIADRFATHVFRLWFEEAVNAGLIKTMIGKPDFYEGMNRDAYTTCEWLGADRGQIDELKETQAAMLRVQNNMSTLEDEVGRRGKDWRQVLTQRAQEKELIDELGLTPEPDNRMANAITGDPKDAGEGDKKPAPKKKAV